ncbi:hypothetical protein ABZP36_007539 [Zizania latifolia]
MNWIGRKIHLYNVTIGLYMLDWWERYLFSILPLLAPLVPLLISLYPQICDRNLKTILQGGNYLVQGRKLP